MEKLQLVRKLVFSPAIAWQTAYIENNWLNSWGILASDRAKSRNLTLRDNL